MLEFWEPTIGPMRFPVEAVPMMIPITAHEAGHAEAASHFGARVRGIAMVLRNPGFGAETIYELPADLSVDNKCTLYAAGSAGEVLEFGGYTSEGASGDQLDMLNVSGDDLVPYEPFVEKAKAILMARRSNFNRISRLLKWRLFYTNACLMMSTLSNGKTGAFIIKEHELQASQAQPAR